MNSEKFPYRHLESLPAWDVVDQAVEKLVCNDDLVETTARRNIVGFIVNELSVSGLLESKGRKKAQAPK